MQLTEVKLPTEAELIQAIRIARRGDSVIHELCEMLDALREGRLIVNTYRGYLTDSETTIYDGIRIKKREYKKDE